MNDYTYIKYNGFTRVPNKDDSSQLDVKVTESHASFKANDAIDALEKCLKFKKFIKFYPDLHIQDRMSEFFNDLEIQSQFRILIWTVDKRSEVRDAFLRTYFRPYTELAELRRELGTEYDNHLEFLHEWLHTQFKFSMQCLKSTIHSRKEQAANRLQRRK